MHTHKYSHRHTCYNNGNVSLFLTALALGVGDQPLQGDIDIILFFARDAVAADFPVLYAGEVHSLYQTSLVERSGNVPFVT